MFYIIFTVSEHLERFHHFLDYERYEFENTMRYINAMQSIQTHPESYRPNTPSQSRNSNRPQSPIVIPETPRSPSLFDEDSQSTNFEKDDGIEILQAAAAAASDQLQRVPEVQRVEEEVDVRVEHHVEQRGEPERVMVVQPAQ